MSFLMNAVLSDGIVMSSDSMLTFNKTMDGRTLSSPKSHSIQKSLLIESKNIGISYYGDLCINNMLISKFLNDFINDEDILRNIDIDSASDMLIQYLKDITNTLPDTYFYIGGYRTLEKRNCSVLYYFSLKEGKINKLHDDDIKTQGSYWYGGDTNFFKLLSNEATIRDDEKLQFHGYPVNLYSVQDGIDFCEFSIRTTSQLQRFQATSVTVGGDISIIVLTPYGSKQIMLK